MASRNQRSRPIPVLGISVLVLVSSSFGVTTAAARTRALSCGDAWNLAPIVPTTGSWGVQATAASSPSDAWVVSTGFSNVGFNFPIPQHWDGTAWTIEPLPGGGVQWLFGVASLGPTDAWAVGYAYSGYAYRYSVMITHWDGSSWSDVPSPGRLGAYSELKGIDAVSADDVWAVGDSRQAPLIEHWDGTSWTVVPGPSVGATASWSSLDAVSLDASDDGWAVGSITTQRPHSYVARPLLVHWDGARWARERRPMGVETLSDLVTLAPDDAWAVGSSGRRTVAVHWDGRSWSVVPTPSPGTSATLASVAGLGTTGVWAVGSQRSHPGAALRTLIERWDGSAWQEEPSQNVGPKNNVLVSVSAVPGLLVAGGYSGGGRAPLALERCPT